MSDDSSGPTPVRAIRIPDDLWRESLEVARKENTTVTAIVVAALRRRVRRHRKAQGAVPPPA